MFTGIIEELAEVLAVEVLPDSARLRIAGPRVTDGARHGDSIAVNGVCLTVVDTADGAFTADVMRETLDRSGLGDLRPGSRVNVERPVTLADRLGGHLVQGHVDATATLLERVPGEQWEVLRLSLPEELARYVVHKGSITVDGASLTVAAVGADWFTVSLIPTTLALTTLGALEVGGRVNLEVDVVAKHVEKLLAARPAAAARPAPGTTARTGLDPVERAVADLAAGRVVVVVDDEDREDEGDLVLAAQAATPEAVAFMVRHTSGVLCVPMPGPELDRLGLPPMVAVNEDPKGTAYAVSVDAREGVSTGISAADRARTIRALADPATRAGDLTRPGHVFPLRAAPGGVLQRPGHTEAGVDLARLAGLAPVAVIAEVVTDDGSMARLPDLLALAAEHGLAVVSVADLAAHLRAGAGAQAPAAAPAGVQRVAQAQLPTRHGVFTAVGYADAADGVSHVALVAGDLAGDLGDAAGADGPGVLVRIHSECLTGDVLGSARCDCGDQLDASLAAVAEAGGVVVYLRGHEGRGIGLLDKLRAYAAQDAGADTVDANLALGLPVDSRDYTAAALVLRDLGVGRVRLLTNNPLKTGALVEHGIEVTERVALPVAATAANVGYLRTKRDRMGHLLPGLLEVPASDGRRGA